MHKYLDDFDDHVTPFELRKGQDYFHRKKVTRLNSSFTGKWTAAVQGRELYKVEIKIVQGEIISVLCDCIAHVDNEYCKHVTATLLAIREAIKTSAAGNAGLTAGNSGPTATNPTATNPNSNAATNPTAATMEKNTWPNPEQETQALVQQCKTLLAQQEYRGALDIARDMIGAMPRYEDQPKYVDVEEEITQRTNEGFKLLLAIARSPIPEELQARIYKRATIASLEPRYNLFYHDPHWIDVLMVLSAGKEQAVLAVVDQLLVASEHKSAEIISRIVLLKTQLLRLLHRQKEVYALMAEYPQAEGLRALLILESVEKGDLGEATRLAEQGMNWGRYNHVNQYIRFRDTLQQLATRSNDKEALRRLYRGQYQETKDLKYYRQLKATYTPKEWADVLKKDIAVHANPGERAAICREEQDWPGLLKILKKEARLGLTEMYTDSLLPLYPDEMLTLYEKMIAAYVADNKHADALAEIQTLLTRIRKWAGGKEAVVRLITEFKTKYSTRKKLMEVLDRI